MTRRASDCRATVPVAAGTQRAPTAASEAACPTTLAAKPPRALHIKLPAALFPALLLALSGAATPSRGADFQLRDYSYSEDSLTYHGVYFQKDPQTRVALSPPSGWNTSGDAAALTLTPPNAVGSLVRLEKSPVPPSTPFKDKGLDVYRQSVLASVVNGATGVQVVEEHADAFSFFNWHAHEFVVGYNFYGQSYQRSTLFVNVSPTEQFILTTVAPKDNFKATRETALGVLRSWHVVSAE